MDGAVLKSVTMMAIALPTMFIVIGVFMLATTLLHKAFPASDDEEEE
ncbi:hypothetical protein SAMN05660742_110127 [Propionispira arboris]|uniref:Uncharacterized protein n=1 Tax=Propionispira arboris TaxID=84035 RepID=A0A1H6ZW62_9FIRM|nr:hypothetical protein [Propionispira arboris]SEJ56886.1 hypothetical protein SAMN05660742_110127 [Propionispira arboris]